MRRSFDILAEVYEPLERIFFGSTLQRARCHFLPQAMRCRRGLLIGDGDGRFSRELLERNPFILVDSIDSSPAMLERAKQRAGDQGARLKTQCADALNYPYPDAYYDFIGLHFCLDCFTQQQLATLLPRIESSLKPGGIVVYSDFVATSFWQRAIVRCLYLCFRLTTGLEARSLPQVPWGSDLSLAGKQTFLGGLIETQLLEKSGRSNPPAPF